MTFLFVTAGSAGGSAQQATALPQTKNNRVFFPALATVPIFSIETNLDRGLGRDCKDHHLTYKYPNSIINPNHPNPKSG